MSITQISARETALEGENARLWAELFAAREQGEKQRKVLEQALEALEGTEALLSSMDVTRLLIYKEVDKAITAIQGALA